MISDIWTEGLNYDRWKWAGAQFADCLSSMREALASIPALQKVGVGVNKQVEVEGSKVQVLPGHTGRLKPCLTP